jgi:antitoxin YefM
MAIRTSYTQARANLAKLLEKVTRDRETVIIERRGEKEVALISAEELAGLEETAHLLRSPKNAERLLAALTRALGRTVKPSRVEDLRRELGLEPEEAA